MELTKKQSICKYTVYCLILLLCDLLQNVSGLFPEIGRARCFLLLPVAVILSMGEDERAAGLLGLFAGMLWDLTSPVHMGFNCIYFTVICFFSAALVTYIIRDNLLTVMIYTVVSIIVYCLLYWLFFIVIKDVGGAEWSLFYFYIPCAVYSSVLSPVLWFLLRPLKRKLNRH